jgi:high-affinity Fe2+/Pb2+ permease
MTEIYEIYNTLDKLASPENLIYATKAITGAFVLSVGAFFYTEYKKFKKAEENKIKKNLEGLLKEK